MRSVIGKWLAVLLACSGCSSRESPTEVSRSKQEKSDIAIRKIESLGGSVLWEREIFVVALPGTSIQDDDLAIFSDLSDVEVLDLSNTALTDACIEYLQQLKKLETLYLINTRLSDSGLDRLRAQLPNAAINPVHQKLPNPFKPGTWLPESQ